jgi:type 1 glutamine amidotransferase
VPEPSEPASAPLHVVLLTGGHGYQRAAYLDMFAGMPGLRLTHVEHRGPTANGWEHPSLEGCDAVLLYDLQQHITEEQRARLLGLLARGAGLVVTHHALVSFQSWPEYERIIGGRYVERAEGAALGSSYRLDVDVPVRIADGAHPVTSGLQGFTLRDEIYIGFRVSPEVKPLLVTSQPESGNPIAWTRSEGGARIVYLQPGHGPETYGSPEYRRLLLNSLRFVALRRVS